MKHDIGISPRGFACDDCQREYEDQIELLEMRLSNEHPDWSMTRLKARAVIEYGKGVRVVEGDR